MKEGWKVVKLGDVCDIGIGKTPSRSDLSLWDKNRTTRNLWVSIADMGTATKGYISETKEYISDKAAQDIRIIPKGTILLSFKLTLGKTAIAGEDLYTNEAIANLPIKLDSLNREFLLYYFQYFNWDDYASGDEKVMGKTLNKKKLEVLPVFLPPLPEQHRIVKILDAAFEKIDAMKANAEKNLENAKALFQQVLAEELKPKEGWEEKKFGEVSSYYKEQGKYDNIRYIGMEHIESGSGNILGYINSCEVLSSSFKFKKDQVLYGRLRPYLKKAYVAEFDGCCSTEIFPICSDVIISEFIKYWLLSDKITNMINATSAGCRMPRGNMEHVKSFIICYPNDSVNQHQIVEKLDALSAKCKRMEEVAKKTIEECEALKQSILKQAFNGEL